MAKDTNRLELTKQVQDKKFRGVNLKTGERGLRELAEKRSDDTYGTPLSKGAISAGRQKLKDAGVSLQGSSKAAKADKEAAQAAREAGAEERREARGMKKGGSTSKWIQSAIKKPGAQRQQEQNEQEKQQVSSSSNNLPELLKRQRDIDNG